ncbi:MAG: transcriptional repressor [Ktedonobacteraceae bacterium]|nr:transcriptional repressor [Ktedonobacteraceae bacterium]
MDVPDLKGPDTETILAALAHAGLKRTHPREVIAAYVAQKGTENLDFTIENLCHEVRTRHVDFARVTAFRVIECLVQLGIVDRLTFPDGAIRYHVGKGSIRHYLTCDHCHKVVELHLGFVPPLLDSIMQLSGFVRTNHPVEIPGRCPDCQEHEDRERKK